MSLDPSPGTEKVTSPGGIEYEIPEKDGKPGRWPRLKKEERAKVMESHKEAFAGKYKEGAKYKRTELHNDVWEQTAGPEKKYKFGPIKANDSRLKGRPVSGAILLAFKQELPEPEARELMFYATDRLENAEENQTLGNFDNSGLNNIHLVEKTDDIRVYKEDDTDRWKLKVVDEDGNTRLDGHLFPKKNTAADEGDDEDDEEPAEGLDGVEDDEEPAEGADKDEPDDTEDPSGTPDTDGDEADEEEKLEEPKDDSSTPEEAKGAGREKIEDPSSTPETTEINKAEVSELLPSIPDSSIEISDGEFKEVRIMNDPYPDLKIGQFINSKEEREFYQIHPGVEDFHYESFPSLEEAAAMIEMIYVAETMMKGVAADVENPYFLHENYKAVKEYEFDVGSTQIAFRSKRGVVTLEKNVSTKDIETSRLVIEYLNARHATLTQPTDHLSGSADLEAREPQLSDAIRIEMKRIEALTGFDIGIKDPEGHEDFGPVRDSLQKLLIGLNIANQDPLVQAKRGEIEIVFNDHEGWSLMDGEIFEGWFSDKETGLIDGKVAINPYTSPEEIAKIVRLAAEQIEAAPELAEPSETETAESSDESTEATEDLDDLESFRQENHIDLRLLTEGGEYNYTVGEVKHSLIKDATFALLLASSHDARVQDLGPYLIAPAGDERSGPTTMEIDGESKEVFIIASTWHEEEGKSTSEILNYISEASPETPMNIDALNAKLTEVLRQIDWPKGIGMSNPQEFANAIDGLFPEISLGREQADGSFSKDIAIAYNPENHYLFTQDASTMSDMGRRTEIKINGQSSYSVNRLKDVIPIAANHLAGGEGASESSESSEAPSLEVIQAKLNALNDRLHEKGLGTAGWITDSIGLPSNYESLKYNWKELEAALENGSALEQGIQSALELNPEIAEGMNLTIYPSGAARTGLSWYKDSDIRHIRVNPGESATEITKGILFAHDANFGTEIGINQFPGEQLEHINSKMLYIRDKLRLNAFGLYSEPETRGYDYNQIITNLDGIASSIEAAIRINPQVKSMDILLAPPSNAKGIKKYNDSESYYLDLDYSLSPKRIKSSILEAAYALFGTDLADTPEMSKEEAIQHAQSKLTELISRLDDEYNTDGYDLWAGDTVNLFSNAEVQDNDWLEIAHLFEEGTALETGLILAFKARPDIIENDIKIFIDDRSKPTHAYIDEGNAYIKLNPYESSSVMAHNIQLAADKILSIEREESDVRTPEDARTALVGMKQRLREKGVGLNISMQEGIPGSTDWNLLTDQLRSEGELEMTLMNASYKNPKINGIEIDIKTDPSLKTRAVITDKTTYIALNPYENSTSMLNSILEAVDEITEWELEHPRATRESIIASLNHYERKLGLKELGLYESYGAENYDNFSFAPYIPDIMEGISQAAAQDTRVLEIPIYLPPNELPSGLRKFEDGGNYIDLTYLSGTADAKEAVLAAIRQMDREDKAAEESVEIE